MKNQSKKILDVPKPDIWDIFYQVNKTALSVVPPIGLFYEVVIAPPFQKRTIEWMESINNTIYELDKRYNDLKYENLALNELFHTAFNILSKIAIQTHQKEKLEILKSALINTVIIKNIDENYKLMFINNLEKLTELHLNIFAFLNNWDDNKVKQFPDILSQSNNYFDEFVSKSNVDGNLYDLICLDLKNWGLIESTLEESKTYKMNYYYITEYGKKFAQFINSDF